MRTVHARVWPTHESFTGYPEQTTDSDHAPRSTGVCFSGGSTRSYAATVGQLRGLTEAGLIPQIGYVSAVSGGAWAAVPYTFYPETATETEILGVHERPEALSMTTLSSMSRKALGVAATEDFARHLQGARADGALQPGESWCHAVGQTFLAPFGLFDPQHPAGFTLGVDTADQIRSRHASLRETLFHTVRDNRPYLLIHAALNWPDDPTESDLTAVSRVGFEFAPLGIGTPSLLTLESDRHPPHSVGGGFVEPFAFGSAAPTAPADAQRRVQVDLPPRLFTLADAIGASSAFSTPDRDLSDYPHAAAWPVGHAMDGTPRTTREAFTDGGDVENYGLIPLLRRRVRAVIVFVNTVWPLSLEHDPVRWPTDTADGYPGHREIDPFLPALFGAPSPRFGTNRVFPEADYPAVVSGLQAAKRRGDPVMTVTTHEVEANDWWGLPAGHRVKVCWVYNEYVERWAERLPTDVRGLVEDGRRSPVTARTGPFAHFPHYLTRGQNPGALIQLSPAQINLLAHLSSWNIVSCREMLEEFLETT